MQTLDCTKAVKWKGWGSERGKERGEERKNMSCKIVQSRKNEGTKNGPV